ncbi:unnamed protein product [Arabidopsis halleri]
MKTHLQPLLHLFSFSIEHVTRAIKGKIEESTYSQFQFYRLYMKLSMGLPSLFSSIEFSCVTIIHPLQLPKFFDSFDFS